MCPLRSDEQCPPTLSRIVPQYPQACMHWNPKPPSMAPACVFIQVKVRTQKTLSRDEMIRNGQVGGSSMGPLIYRVAVPSF